MRRILLTGGRAPATLDLARKLQGAGHDVFVAESLRFPLTRGSRAVRHSYRVAPPRQAPDAFQRDIEQIVEGEKIDLLVPTCEEIFYVARFQQDLSCDVFCDRADKLARLHSKWEFVRWAAELELPVPATELLTSSEELERVLADGRPRVLKPEYSRFACETRMTDTSARPTPTPARRWLAQEYVEGRELASYSIARQGRVFAHVTYPVSYRAGLGSGVFFEACEHPAIEGWVSRFVEAAAFSGQIAFDFIENDNGVFALECNPRMTSGIHLFGTQVADAFAAPGPARIGPVAGKAMLAGAMVLFVRPIDGEWTRSFFSARDVLFRPWDPWPALGQLLTLAELRGVARRRGTDLLAASTFDIEWNGPA